MSRQSSASSSVLFCLPVYRPTLCIHDGQFFRKCLDLNYCWPVCHHCLTVREFGDHCHDQHQARVFPCVNNQLCDSVTKCLDRHVALNFLLCLGQCVGKCLLVHLCWHVNQPSVLKSAYTFSPLARFYLVSRPLSPLARKRLCYLCSALT